LIINPVDIYILCVDFANTFFILILTEWNFIDSLKIGVLLNERLKEARRYTHIALLPQRDG